MLKSIMDKLALKSKARKPIHKIETYLKYSFAVTEVEKYYCPRCDHVLNAGPNYQPKYCGQCGQRISFDGIEWKADKHLGYAEEAAYEPLKNRMV